MPIYEYEHVSDRGAACPVVIEVFQAMSAEPLTTCPECHLPVHRIISNCHGKVNILSKSNLKEKGFTKLVRRDKGVYEKE